MYIHPTDLIHLGKRRADDLIEAADNRRLARFARRAHRRSGG